MREIIETGKYKHNPDLDVIVRVRRTGSVHASDDYYSAYITTLDGEYVDRFDDMIRSGFPSFVVENTRKVLSIKNE